MGQKKRVKQKDIKDNLKGSTCPKCHGVGLIDDWTCIYYCTCLVGKDLKKRAKEHHKPPRSKPVRPIQRIDRNGDSFSNSLEAKRLRRLRYFSGGGDGDPPEPPELSNIVGWGY